MENQIIDFGIKEKMRKVKTSKRNFVKKSFELKSSVWSKIKCEPVAYLKNFLIVSE